TGEDGFDVVRLNAVGGNPTTVSQVATRDKPGIGGTYSFTDTTTSGVRQCYEIMVHDDTSHVSDFSEQVCTAPPAAVTAPNPLPLGMVSFPIPSDANGFANTGQYASMTVGSDGLGIAAYYVG